MSESSAEELNRLQDAAYGELNRKNYRRSRELFETLHQQAPVEASMFLGYIHAIKDTPDYNPDQARQYLQFAADAGDIQAMNYLGYLLDDLGQRDEAIAWWLHASERGDSDSSSLAAWALRKQGHLEQADKLLKIAASQGDASAIQIVALDKIKGRDGIAQVPSGLLKLAKNFVPLLRYIKQRV